jgi:hypothetical protein
MSTITSKIQTNREAYEAALNAIRTESHNRDGVVASRLLEAQSNAHRYGLMCQISNATRLADIAAAKKI